jgi:hypothetical protein
VAGAIAPPTVLEEIHSTAEELLRSALSTPKYAFPAVVEQAVAQELLDPCDGDALKTMNTLRVDVKHHGQPVTMDEVLHHYLAIFPAVIDLATRVRQDHRLPPSEV